MTRPEDQILKLEEEIAHLTLANEELSTELLQQWKRVEEIERKFAKLENRFHSMEEAMHNPIENTKPPHY